MALARLPFFPGPVYLGARPFSPVHSLPGREGALLALVAAGVCAVLQAVLRGSPARPALAAGAAWARCQAVRPGLGVREVRLWVCEALFRSARRSADVWEA